MNWWAVATTALGDGYSGAVSEFGSGVVDVLLCGHACGPGVTGRHARSRGWFGARWGMVRARCGLAKFMLCLP